MPKAGTTSTKRPPHHCMQARARARANEFGPLFIRVYAHEKELDRPVRSLYRNCQVCGLVLTGAC